MDDSRRRRRRLSSDRPSVCLSLLRLLPQLIIRRTTPDDWCNYITDSGVVRVGRTCLRFTGHSRVYFLIRVNPDISPACHCQPALTTAINNVLINFRKIFPVFSTLWYFSFTFSGAAFLFDPSKIQLCESITLLTLDNYIWIIGRSTCESKWNINAVFLW